MFLTLSMIHSPPHVLSLTCGLSFNSYLRVTLQDPTNRCGHLPGSLLASKDRLDLSDQGKQEMLADKAHIIRVWGGASTARELLSTENL